MLLLLCGCGLKQAERLDDLFGAATRDLRAGELSKAQLAAERGIALAAARHDAFEQWKFRLLRCEILLYLPRFEEAANQLREEMPATPPFAALRARKMMLQARVLFGLRRTEEGDALLRTAHDAAEAAGAPEVLLDIENVEASRMSARHLDEAAEPLLRRALARAQAIHADYGEAGVQVNLGMIRIRQSHFDEAIPYFERAAALAGPVARPLYNVARNNLAICYSQLGDHDRALEIHLQAVTENDKSGGKLLLHNALGETGHTYMVKADPKSAIPYLQRALSLAIEVKAFAGAAIWAGNLSECYSELHDWNEAASINQEAIRLKTAAGVQTLYYNVLNAARIARGRGDLEEAARLYQQAMTEGPRDPGVLWESQAGLGAVSLQQKHPAEAVEHFEAAVKVLEEMRAGVNGAEMKLAFLTQRIRLYQEYVDTLVDQNAADRALAVADSSRAQALADRGDSPLGGRLPVEAFRNIARQSGAILLSYWLGPTRSHAWVVTGRDLRHVTLPPAADIESLVREYKDALELRLADPLRSRIPAGERLYDVLLAPVRQWIPAGSRVIVATDGILHGLNLEALPLPAEGGDAPRYWIEDVTLGIVPSLALLAERQARTTQVRRLLLLGNPLPSDVTLGRLAHAAGEMESVSRSFGGPEQVVLAGSAATPGAYRAAGPERFSAIHFTAHAQANRESPLDSAVLLTGGKLYAREVMDTRLTADLVTVSACRGVGLRTYSGEGLVGFAWAFLHAGARHVIAGLWDVNDQSTAELMDVLYRELAAGKSAAVALRTAKLSLIHTPGNLRKPYYWAPFQLYTTTP
ncbi:MAG: CHAT domain-containing protein [Candidatus Solibacter sp.]